MARHVCDNCGAVVTDEEFCPNCGSWIDTMDESAGGEVESFQLGSAPPPEYETGPRVVTGREIPCPSCGAQNPSGNRHCEECGARLSQAKLPVAPRPAVQSPAGVRAAMALAILLGAIVFIAILFNLFSGEGESTTTTAAAVSTTTQPAQIAPVGIIDAECSIEGYSGLDCDNLRDKGDGEYQFNWETVPADAKITITLTFDQPYQVRSINWVNLPDSNRYYQNYRAKTITVYDFSPNVSPFGIPLKDSPGATTYAYISVSTSKLEIEITDAYVSEEREGNVFQDLAIREIEVLGSPVIIPTDTTVPATTTATTAG